MKRSLQLACFGLGVVSSTLAFGQPPDDLTLGPAARLKAEAMTDFSLGMLMVAQRGKLGREALDKFLEALKKDPRASYPLGYLKLYWFTNKQFQECVDALAPLARNNPKANSLVLTAAEAMIHLKQYAEAAKLLENSLSNGGVWTRGDAAKIILLGNLRKALREFDAGEILYGEALAEPCFANDFNVRAAAAEFYGVKGAEEVESVFPAWIAEWSKRRFRRQALANVEACLRLLDSSKPKLAQVVALLDICWKLKDFPLYESLAAAALDQFPGDPTLRNLLAYYYFDSGEHGKAAASWEALKDTDPLNPAYPLELGKCYYQMNKRGKAEANLRRCLDLKPGDQAALFLLGVCQMQRRQRREAVESFDQVEQLPRAKYFAAVCLDALGETAVALEHLDAAEKIAQARPETKGQIDTAFLLLKSELLDRAGRFDQSVASLRQALKASPDDPAILNFLGYSLADRGVSLDEAESLIAKALELRPDNAAYLDSMAWVLFRQRRFQEASRYIDQAVAACGEELDGEVADHAGDIRAALGDPQGAREYWEAAAKSDSKELDREALQKKLRGAVKP